MDVKYREITAKTRELNFLQKWIYPTNVHKSIMYIRYIMPGSMVVVNVLPPIITPLSWQGGLSRSWHIYKTLSSCFLLWAVGISF